MSAIFGTVFLDGRTADAEQLRRTGELLAHRGPDGAGYWCERGAALGHRLLSTTPESVGNSQPLICPLTGQVVVADARLDNRQELTAALALQQAGAYHRDEELILRAYQRWGADCAARLIGDFAFAIWDPKTQTLFCARDPFGVRSLYYHHAPGQSFTFATEIKGVVNQPHVPTRIDEQYIGIYLVEGYSTSSRTIYADVRKVAPAHSLTVSPGPLRFDRYWQVDTEKQLRLRTDNDYAEAFRELFQTAVTARLRSNGPVGSLLSGGLDSSSITVCAHEALGSEPSRKLHTFSLIFPGVGEDDRRRIDERPFIHSVLERLDAEAHFVEGDRLDPFSCSASSINSQDQPVFAPNLYLHEGIYSAARDAKIRVLLDGIDGDTVVSYGWERLTDLAARARYGELLTQASALADRYGVSLRYILTHQLIIPSLPKSLLRMIDRWTGRNIAGIKDTSFLNRSYADRYQRYRKDRERASTSAVRTKRLGSRASLAHAEGIESGLITHIVELADKSAGSFGIEPRYPFLDRRLVEFCVSLPADQKLRDGWHRFILRNSLSPLLPKLVAWRTCKGNLAPSFCRRFRSDDPARLKQALAHHSGRLQSYFDLDRLGQMLQRYLDAPIAHNAEAMNLYNALLLGQWLEERG